MGFDFERLGRRIAEERKHFRKVSQEKMAEALGMYQADISNLEHARKGSGITDLSRLDLIAEYLDIPLESMLFGTNKSNHMVPYYRNKLEMKAVDRRKKFPPKHRQRLEMLMGIDPVTSPIFRYECGPYTMYMAGERQSILGQHLEEEFYLFKLHTFTFVGDEIIASMVADLTSVMQYIYGDMILSLQQVIQPDVLDPVDVRRRLNPFDPLYEFAVSDSQKAEMAEKSSERFESLMKHRDLKVMMIESIYVSEDCRQMGVCRMMLDLLRFGFGDCILWLNMEPTAGDELSEEYNYFPAYSASDVGQLNLNAAIAEKLGFTIDPELWHREAETVDASGEKTRKVLEVRKCAYQMPPVIAQIIENDGDLVQLGRAQQKLAQGNSDPCPISDFSHKEIDGNFIVELRTQTQGHTRYSYGVIKEDGSTYLATSLDSPIRTRLACLEQEHYNSLKDAEGSEFYQDLKVVASFMPMFDREKKKGIIRHALRKEKVRGCMIQEIRRQRSDTVLYVYSVTQEDGNVYYGVSAESPIDTKLTCFEMEHYDCLEDAEDSPCYTELKLIAGPK